MDITLPKRWLPSFSSLPPRGAGETTEGETGCEDLSMACWRSDAAILPGSPDTLQLDYSKEATQEAMISELLKNSEQCEGLRSDMAMLVLPDMFERTRQGNEPQRRGLYLELPPWGASLFSMAKQTQ